MGLLRLVSAEGVTGVLSGATENPCAAACGWWRCSHLQGPLPCGKEHLCLWGSSSVPGGLLHLQKGEAFLLIHKAVCFGLFVLHELFLVTARITLGAGVCHWSEGFCVLAWAWPPPEAAGATLLVGRMTLDSHGTCHTMLL